ncbi:MAG: acetylxylan esterase [Lacisediminihabitans sp.]
MSERELWDYRSDVHLPTDFDQFWRETMAEASSHDLAVTAEPVDTDMVTLDIFDVSFAGFGGHKIRGWFITPVGAEWPLPVVVQYCRLRWRAWRSTRPPRVHSSGYAHLVMDTRGQGSAWSVGDTPDPIGSGPSVPGFLTRGIKSRENYYYRRLFTDAVRAVDEAKQFPRVDPSRVAVVGGCRGGGIALAVVALRDDLAGVVAFVPFLCDMRRASVITDSGPFAELGRCLATHRHSVEVVFDTLAYFDGVNMARRATVPVWISVALMDPICPQPTVFGTFQEYAGPKKLTVWPYNNHAGGGMEDLGIALRAFRGVFAQA